MQDIIANNEYLNGNRTNSLINRKMIFRILGILLFIEGVMFLVCAGVSLCYKEHSYIYFIYSTLITAVAGAVLVFLGRKAENKLSRRDGYCIVAFTWLLFTVFGMLPFYLSGEIPSVSDAFSKRCQDLPQQGRPFSMTLSLYRMVCCFGVVFPSGLEV